MGSFEHIGWKRIGAFACGVLFGTAGVSVLASKDAKKCYTHVVAAGLRAKESVMTTVTKIRENADDILADAEEINEKRAAAAAEVIEAEAAGEEAEAGASGEDGCEVVE